MEHDKRARSIYGTSRSSKVRGSREVCEDSARNYNRDRYQVCNRDDAFRTDGRISRSKSSNVYSSKGYGSRSRSGPSSGETIAEADSVRRRERSSRSTQRSRQSQASSRRDCSASSSRNSQGSHSIPSQGPIIPLPVIILVLILVLGITVFALTRCNAVGGATLQSTNEQASGIADEESQPSEEELIASFLPTPYIAECKGIYLHSAVRSDQLTEILIHNASYSYALPLTTRLTEATNADVMAAHGTGRDASLQPTGNAWLTGEFIRCFRSSSEGPKLSAIDCGGPVRATVYAPVSGTVVKVKEYDLYGDPACPDVQVHIQPEGHPELDVVLIHLENEIVREGDIVVGGETPIAMIRDVYAYVGDEMQLKGYTAEEDNGNHTHIQVNDVNRKDYHGLDD